MLKAKATLAYTPSGFPIRLADNADLFSSLVSWWYDPRTGRAEHATPDGVTYRRPGAPYRGNDWVLVLDDAT